MVCLPCLLPPILLAIFIKFIQPIILRLLPQSWRKAFDALLYPTCAIPTAPAENVASTIDKVPDACGGDYQNEDDCDGCPGSSKKDV
ncbi:unnamed protein product [Litomosoides sigmodontis]|uniref:Uncharacterized protein n=1 Tax=Litomosoides sigmodontis TaxID=42156 RepID=A0A3P6U1P8_LITSI|nr:unnamed protein product [Litomosoides sigmodontis]